jgi:hypothetical protein
MNPKYLREQMEIMSAGAQGGFGPLYYHVLPMLINTFGYETGAEIGVCLGGNSEGILQNTKVSKLYSVDPYVYNPLSTDGHVLPNGRLFEQRDYDAMYEYTKDRLAVFGDRSKFIRETSVEAAYFFPDKALDFIFIDALHTEKDLTDDLEAWTPKIIKGGMVSGHDYNHPSFPGIKTAVHKFFGTPNVEDGYVWWVKI